MKIYMAPNSEVECDSITHCVDCLNSLYHFHTDCLNWDKREPQFGRDPNVTYLV